MRRTMCKSKIHRAVVTEANLNYEGSVTIDAELMRQADILPFERVQVINIANGARIETYAMEGDPGSGTICLNGGAARLFHPGDLVIIISYADYTEEEARALVPTLVFVDEHNRVARVQRGEAVLPQA